jgi:hypothetical protein
VPGASGDRCTSRLRFVLMCRCEDSSLPASAMTAPVSDIGEQGVRRERERVGGGRTQRYPLLSARAVAVGNELFLFAGGPRAYATRQWRVVVDVEFEQVVLLIRHCGNGAIEAASALILQEPQVQRCLSLVACREWNVLKLPSIGVLDVFARLASAAPHTDHQHVGSEHVAGVASRMELTYMFRLRHSTGIASPLL